MQHKNTLLPLYGILIFFVLYILSASFYPGGNVADKMQTGFDWFHNYWCDLLETKAMNGQNNAAKPLAVVALILLLVSLGYLFFLFPKHFPINSNKARIWNKIITYAGASSVFLTYFITTSFHDYTIGISSFLGLLAMLGIFISLKYHSKRSYLITGWMALGLLLLNNLMYYTRMGEFYLPLMQKVGFAAVLTWFASLSVIMHRKKKSLSSKGV